MSSRRVTVFGGTRFLGRRIVRHLHDADFVVRIASRHPEQSRSLLSGNVSDIESVRADANDDAGPRVYTYQALLRTIAASAGTRPFLVPFPFGLWRVIGYVSEALPSPPITRNQVELMKQDNVPAPDAPGFEALQISPQAIENILPQMLQAAREKAEA